MVILPSDTSDGTILTDAGVKAGHSVAVLGGTLSHGPATFGGKFFRVTIAGNRVSGWDLTSIAEFSLYAADGTRVNKGTFADKSASVAEVKDLAAGEVWLDANGGTVWEKSPTSLTATPGRCSLSPR